MNGVLYSSRDEAVLDNIRQFIDERRAINDIRPCCAIYIYITGDGGTGKTHMQTSLRGLPNITPIYTGSTNVASQVLIKTFVDSQKFGPEHEVKQTIFTQFCMDPLKWSDLNAILYSKVSKQCSAGTAINPLAFYTELDPYLRLQCQVVLDRIESRAKTGHLDPAEYAKYRKHAEAKMRGETDPRKLHARTMHFISGRYPRTQIPDQLLYDTYVIDEAGRLECTWLFVLIMCHHLIHERYNTGCNKPVVIMVGSATQSNAINDTCFGGRGCAITRGTDDVYSRICSHKKITINDRSMITAIKDSNLLYSEDVYAKLNKHNRRTKTGDPTKSAKLAMFINGLEMGEPIPADVMEFIQTNMSVSSEEFFSHKCVHLCQTHRDCIRVLKEDKVQEEDILHSIESMTALTTPNEPGQLFYCTSRAGTMFKSANYQQQSWQKRVAKKPEKNAIAKMLLAPPSSSSHSSNDHNPQQQEDGRLFSIWSNTRQFYKYRPYTTTHTARCAIYKAIGTCRDFLTDLTDNEHLYQDNLEVLTGFCQAIVSFLSSSDEPTTLTDQLRERVDSIDASSAEEVCATLHDLKCLLCAFVNKSEEHAKMSIAFMFDSSRGHLLIPKGESVYLVDKISNQTLLVRLGKTLNLCVYSTIFRVNQTPSQYQRVEFDHQRRYDPDGAPINTRTAQPHRKKQKYNNNNNNNDMDGDSMMVGGVLVSCVSDDEDEYGSCSKVQDMDIIYAVAEVNEDESQQPQPIDELKGAAASVLRFFPLKLNLVGTVSAAQGLTLSGLTYCQVKSIVDAYSMIVMSTRCSSSDNIKFFFEGGVGNLHILPLDDVTAATIKRIVSICNATSGYL